MGVNLELYRARIGLFRTNRLGNNHFEMINIEKTCGSLKFIKKLLVSHGIHPNPGPVAVGMGATATSVGIKTILIGGGVLLVVVIAGVVVYHYYKKNRCKKTQQTGTGFQTSSRDTDVDENVKNSHYDMQTGTGFQTSSRDTDVDRKVKDLHYDMVLKLGGYFHPSCKLYWDKLCVLMQKHLDEAMIYNKDIDIGIIFIQLMAKGLISYGNYDTIVNDFKQIHVGAAAIIKETAACISRIRSGKPSYAELEQQVHDIKRKNQEAEQQLRRAYERMIGKMSEQHAKEITEKNQEIEKLRQRNQSEEGTISDSADHEQGPSNIRQRRTTLNAFVAN